MDIGLFTERTTANSPFVRRQAFIIGREFAVTALRSLAHARGATMPASPLGKIKLIAQVVAILALILGKDHLQGFFIIGQIALWVVVVWTDVLEGRGHTHLRADARYARQ